MDALSKLIDALRCLPGVGPKSAQRMAFHLLQHQRQRGLFLAACLEDAMHNIRHCSKCNNYTAEDVCILCNDKTRNQQTICVVESPTDVLAIEQSAAYSGVYFVLMGKISPLDGIGPDELRLPLLKKRVFEHKIEEIILALSPSIEGQTTLHFIRELFASQPIKISQLAHGIPSGGELEFLDSYTISSALRHRIVSLRDGSTQHENASLIEE